MTTDYWSDFQDGPDYGEQTSRTVGDVTYRVRVIVDRDPFPPEFEAGCPVFELEHSYNWGYWSLDPKPYGEDSARHDGLPMAFEDAFSRLSERHDKIAALEVLNRWLRIFHGGSLRHQTAYQDRDPRELVSYDTRAMREHWGQTGDMLEKSAPDAGEWLPYLEGDCYGYVVERALTEEDADEDELDWEEIESCWGFYGQRYAKEEALAELNNSAEQLPSVAVVETRTVPEHTVTTRSLPV